MSCGLTTYKQQLQELYAQVLAIFIILTGIEVYAQVLAIFIILTGIEVYALVLVIFIILTGTGVICTGIGDDRD